MYVQKFVKIDDVVLGELEQVYVVLFEQLQIGVLVQELMNIVLDSKVKILLVLQMQDYFCLFLFNCGSVIFDYYIQCFLWVLMVEEGVLMEQKVSDIEFLLVCCLQVDEQQKNWVFRNLIFYKIWENNFFNQLNVDLLCVLYIIVVEYVFIKLLMVVSVYECGWFEWDDVINIVYSFYFCSQYNSEVVKNFYCYIEMVCIGDDLLMIYFLIQFCLGGVFVYFVYFIWLILFCFLSC